MPESESEGYLGLWRDAIEVLQDEAGAEVDDALFFAVSELTDFPQRAPAELRPKLQSLVEEYANSSNPDLAGMARRFLCRSSNDRYWNDAVAAIMSGADARWDAMTILSLAGAGDSFSRATVEEALIAPAVHQAVRDTFKHGLYRSGRWALWRKTFFTALSRRLGTTISYDDPYLGHQRQEPQPNFTLSVRVNEDNTIKISVLDWQSEVVIDISSPKGNLRAGAFSVERAAAEAAALRVAALMSS